MIGHSFGTAMGPYGDVRLGIEEPFAAKVASVITIAVNIPAEHGMTPMQARALAALLNVAADECDRIRKGPAR